MSGLVGRFHLDGAPVAERAVEAMLGRVAHRGPDGCAVWTRGAVGLGHALLATTPQERCAPQPLWDADAGLCIALHGRIDNRDELLAELGGEGEDTAADAPLVLRAYRQWGERCAARIVGDFAFVLWDEPRRSVLCARDPLGAKPLFYAMAGSALLIASEPAALLAGTGLRAVPDEGVAAEYLAGGPRSMGPTLLEGVRRLPPAHLLRATPRGVSLARFWSFDLHREERAEGDAEYAGRFRAVFGTAVAAHLRTLGPPGLLLSGGVDSASVLCAARALPRGREMIALSMAFPGTLCDESELIDDALRAAPTPSARIDWAPGDAGHFAGRARATLDFPGYPNGDSVYGPLLARARAQGVRAVLTGMGGDEGFTGSLYHYADLIRGLRIAAFARQLAADRRLLRGDLRVVPVVRTQFMLLRHGVFPLVPHAWRWNVKRLLGRALRKPAWLRDDFARRVSLQDRLRPVPPPPGNEHARRSMAELLTRAGSIHETEVLERLAAAHHVELRSPLMDRRVLQFGLSLPEDQRWRGEETKVVLRNAMRGCLPESIARRRTKADFSHMVAEELGGMLRAGFWDALAMQRHGWVDGARLREDAMALDALYRRGDDEYTQHFWPLWMAAGVELWLRALDGAHAAP